jgi:uncharacterized membrane protein YdbT with pleckstrin-like domain
MQPKYFESQQPDEDIIMIIRRHIIALMPIVSVSVLIYVIGLILVLVLPFVAPVLVSGFAYNVYVLIVSLLFLFDTIFLFNNWVLHYLHVAILTTEHFVEINQVGLFSRQISEMTLEKVQDVCASQKGLTNTMFNVGEVEIETAGELPNFIIQFVPDPNGVSQKIMETEETFCRRNGIRTAGTGGNANTNQSNQQANSVMPPQGQQYTEPNIEYPGDELNTNPK